MSNFLQQIIDYKLNELIKAKPHLSGFICRISEASNQKGVAIIGEIKLASPTQPELGLSKDLVDYARIYQKIGCDAISVVTEKHYFDGRPHFVTRVKKHIDLPILQKDFVIDEHQIVESRHLGADAILLIAKILDQKTLAKFVKFTQSLKIEPVVEINDKNDLQKAVNTSVKIIAVNARNLDTFEVDIEKACQLLQKVPKKFIKLGFSGISSKKEMDRYTQAGASGVLIGTSLMQAKDKMQFLLSLRNKRKI